jgi:hypothetical protein
LFSQTLQAAALAPGNFGNYALDLWIEEAFDETNAGILGFPQGQSVHLGMYTTSGATGDLAATGGRFVTGGATIRGGGFGVTDTAGALPSGTTMPQFRDSIGSGGLTGGYDATGLFGLSGNQQLVFNGVFDYRHDSASVGAGAGAADGGSFQTDSYMFRGAVLYRNNTTYFRGAAATSFGSGKETASVDGSSGSFNTRGYFVDGRLGNVFVLLNTTGMPYSPTPSPKAPKPTGGVVVGLDLSGHLGYADSWIDGFTDTSGFTFGTMERDMATSGAAPSFSHPPPATGCCGCHTSPEPSTGNSAFRARSPFRPRRRSPAAILSASSPHRHSGARSGGSMCAAQLGGPWASRAFIRQAPTPTSWAAARPSKFHSTACR